MFDYRPNYIDSSCHTHSIISSSTQSLNSRALAIGPIVIIIIIIILFFNKSACNRTAVDNYKFIRNTANLARHAGQPQLVRKPTPRPVLNYSWGPVPGVGGGGLHFSQPGPNTHNSQAPIGS